MKIFINASNLHMAGGWSVGLGIVKSIFNEPYGHQYVIYVPDRKKYPFADTDQITLIEKPNWIKNIAGSVLSGIYEKQLLSFHKPDKIFTLGNIPMVTSIPQLLMVQWAYLVYPDSMVWASMNFKEKLTRKFKISRIINRLKYVKSITVQTEVMKQRCLKYLPGNLPVNKVGSAFAPIDVNNLSEVIIPPSPNGWNFLCLTHYYSHKNLEILIEVAKTAKTKKKQTRFIVTLNPEQTEVKKYFKKIEEAGVQEYFYNVGIVTMNQLPSVYQFADAFILPTLLETVGLTFYEAMHYHKLIFAPDLDFAHGVCQNAAVYVNPLNAEDILEKILYYMEGEGQKSVKEKVEAGTKLVADNNDWNLAWKDYSSIIEKM